MGKFAFKHERNIMSDHLPLKFCVVCAYLPLFDAFPKILLFFWPPPPVLKIFTLFLENMFCYYYHLILYCLRSHERGCLLSPIVFEMFKKLQRHRSRPSSLQEMKSCKDAKDKSRTSYYIIRHLQHILHEQWQCF